MAGSSDFDVSGVDLASIQVAGVKPIHVSFADVTAPYFPMAGKTSETDCTDSGPDGELDLLMKFKTQELLTAIETINGQQLKDGDQVLVQMTADALGGDALNKKIHISGEDVLLIINKR